MDDDDEYAQEEGDEGSYDDEFGYDDGDDDDGDQMNA